MNQNMNYNVQPQMVPGQTYQPAKKGITIPNNKTLFYALIACIALIVVGCIVPLYNVAGQSVKYLMNDGKLADGIFLIALGAVAIFLTMKNNDKLVLGSIGCQLVSAYLFYDQWSKIKDIKKAYNAYASYLGDSYKFTYGIGFWLVLIGLIGSIVVLGLLWKSMHDKAATQTPYAAPAPVNQPIPQQVPVQTMPTQPVQAVTAKCPYCGTAKDPNAPFCPGCGAKS